MCLGIPGEVIEFVPGQPDLAKVDVSGVRRVINIGLLTDDPPKVGEWVLIHVGFALSKIDEDEAAGGIGQPVEDALHGPPTAESAIEPRDVPKVVPQGLLILVRQIHQFGLGFGKLTLHGARMPIVPRASPLFLQKNDKIRHFQLHFFESEIAH